MKVIPFRLTLSNASLNTYPIWITNLLSETIPLTTDSNGNEQKTTHTNNSLSDLVSSNGIISHNGSYGSSGSSGVGNDDFRRSESDCDVYGRSIDFNAGNITTTTTAAATQISRSGKDSSSSNSSSRYSDRIDHHKGGRDEGANNTFDYWLKTLETGQC